MSEKPESRFPYQGPQTSMERHIQSLVSHLRDQTDSRSGFSRKIEDAMQHAFYLEHAVKELSEDNRRLESMLAVGFPSVSASWLEKPDAMAIAGSLQIVEWRMEAIRWISRLHPHHIHADETGWRRIRKITYRQALRLFRKAFDGSFPQHAIPDDNPTQSPENSTAAPRRK